MLGALLAASMLPGASLATPLYGVYAALNWSYSYLAIGLPYLALSLPLTVFLLQSFFQGLPWSSRTPPGSTAARAGRRSGT